MTHNSQEVSITNEKDLLKRLRRGDSLAFEIIYRNYFCRLHHFANQYLNSKADADDLIQDVFTKLWQKRAVMNADTNLAAWLYTVTKNETFSLLEHIMVVNRYKRNEEMRLLDANYQALKEIKLSENTYFDINQILQESLNKLPPQCRKVFECSRYKMMSNKDIAEQLSISVKTVETHMTRSLSALRAALSDYL